MNSTKFYLSTSGGAVVPAAWVEGSDDYMACSGRDTGRWLRPLYPFVCWRTSCIPQLPLVHFFV